MKFLAISVFILSTISVYSQQLERFLLEDWVSGAWENRMEQLPFYTEDGRLTRTEISHWNTHAHQWEKKTKTEFTRDKNGNLAGKVLSDWVIDEASWKETTRISYVLNAISKPSVILNEVQTPSGWESKSMEEATYDENGNLNEKIIQLWNKDQSRWIEERKFVYEFDMMQLQGYSIFVWDKITSNWRPYKKATYIYTAADRSLESIRYETWQDENWIDHSIRRNKEYDAGYLQLVEVELVDPSSATWKKSSRVEYSMTDFDKLNQTISKKWNVDDGVWENLQRSTYTYSKDGQMIEDWSEESAQMELFPNPASEKMMLRSLPNGTITIVDAQGKVIQTIVDNELESIQVDVSKWENGIYSIRVADNEVKRFVKQ